MSAQWKYERWKTWKTILELLMKARQNTFEGFCVYDCFVLCYVTWVNAYHWMFVYICDEFSGFGFVLRFGAC